MNAPPELQRVMAVMKNRGFVVFDDPHGYDLNLVGIRTPSVEGDAFDDWLTCFYRVQEAWQYFAFSATTDPGTYYRQNLANVDGTAIVVPDQYRGLWQIGKHKGRYAALVQRSDVRVYRDGNRDEVLNTAGQPIQKGRFGINCHRASIGGPRDTIGRYSAGCQVLQDDAHFDFLMALCRRAAERFGNSFTYTLLREEEVS